MTTLKATVEPGTRGSLPLHYVQGLSVITSATGIADGPASLSTHRTIGACMSAVSPPREGPVVLAMQAELDAGAIAAQRPGSK